MIRRFPFVFSFIIALAFALPVSAQPTSAPECFNVPNISDCIDSRIKSYWNENGGLQVFGYPITPERPEMNRDTGKTYQTQTFERNRFEIHPENNAPYDVLLGRLGAESLAKQGRDFEGIPAGITPGGRCLTFDVGGRPQAVCDPFLGYWESKGLEFDGTAGKSYNESLALFGLPLTYPKRETNANGDTVTTQYFERARFEDHGAKGVLLGLLGRETQGTPSTQPPMTVAVDIRSFSFQPATLEVTAGSRVTWTNRDAAPHTVSQGTSPSPGGLFDSGTLQQDQQFSFTFANPGNYEYFCKIHDSMKGTVKVITP